MKKTQTKFLRLASFGCLFQGHAFCPWVRSLSAGGCRCQLYCWLLRFFPIQPPAKSKSNGNQKQCKGNCSAMSYRTDASHVKYTWAQKTVYGPDGLWRPSMGRGSPPKSATSWPPPMCVYCIWPIWPMETFSGGGGAPKNVTSPETPRWPPPVPTAGCSVLMDIAQQGLAWLITECKINGHSQQIVFFHKVTRETFSHWCCTHPFLHPGTFLLVHRELLLPLLHVCCAFLQSSG